MYSNLCITVLVSFKNVVYVVEGWGGADEAANSDREEERQISASFRQLLLILNKTRRRILPLENAKL